MHFQFWLVVKKRLSLPKSLFTCFFPLLYLIDLYQIVSERSAYSLLLSEGDYTQDRLNNGSDHHLNLISDTLLLQAEGGRVRKQAWKSESKRRSKKGSKKESRLLKQLQVNRLCSLPIRSPSKFPIFQKPLFLFTFFEFGALVTLKLANRY